MIRSPIVFAPMIASGLDPYQTGYVIAPPPKPDPKPDPKPSRVDVVVAADPRNVVTAARLPPRREELIAPVTRDTSPVPAAPTVRPAFQSMTASYRKPKQSKLERRIERNARRNARAAARPYVGPRGRR